MATEINGSAPAPRQCVVCSEDFFSNIKIKKACSPECGFTHDRNRARAYARKKAELTPKVDYPPRPCAECGTEFKPAARTFLYCSPACNSKVQSRRFKRKVAKANQAALSADIRSCLVCEEEFVPAFYQQANCSDGCSHKARVQRNRLRYQPKRVSNPQRQCPECKALYTPRDDRQIGCTVECGAIISKRLAANMRRARLAGSTVERVDPFEVFERDGWRCQLCGIKTPKAQRGKHKRNSPELDHIVPLSRGGEHSYKNTQCLCRACNMSKGARAIGQLRLVG